MMRNEARAQGGGPRFGPPVLGATVLLLLGLAFLQLVLRNGHLYEQIDFDVYLAGTRAALGGKSVYAGGFTHANIPFNYPPSAITLFAAVAKLSDAVAHSLMWIASVVSLAVVVGASARRHQAAKAIHRGNRSGGARTRAGQLRHWWCSSER